MCFVSPCRYFGSVNFTEGRCPGSKAVNFSKLGSFATVPDINITDCNYTIALWIKLFRGDYSLQTIIIGSSITGKTLLRLAITVLDARLFVVEILHQVTFSNIKHLYRSINVFGGDIINKWTHVAVTCEQHYKDKIFIDGVVTTITITVPASMGILDKPPKNMHLIIIGKGVNDTDQLYGSVMDLRIAGFVLPPDKISDLRRGQKFVIFYFLLCL